MSYLRHHRSHRNSACLVVAQLVPILALCQTNEMPLDFQRADFAIVRLSPSRFPQLPPAIRQALTRRGCTIPQVWGDKGAHNVIQGSFIKPKERDWAVLCSIHRTSAILIFHNASPTRVIELARQADIDSLQGEGGGAIGYSRAISPVGRDFIRQHYEIYGGVKPPPMDHEGIDDAFVEKGSVVLYFYQGKWLKLTGSD
jgi:hypothetical protein